jgi:hypothetical protein
MLKTSIYWDYLSAEMCIAKDTCGDACDKNIYKMANTITK